MPSVLKISEAASMALHAVAYLAHSNDGPVATKTIAERLSCSEAHLSKVLQRLTKSGILSATRGPKGGFVLARDTGKITLLEVLETIDGRLSNEACLFESPVCNGEDCILGDLLSSVNERVKSYFEGTTVEQLNGCLRESG